MKIRNTLGALAVVLSSCANPFISIPENVGNTAEEMMDWVHTNIEYVINYEFQTVSETLEKKTGDCLDMGKVLENFIDRKLGNANKVYLLSDDGERGHIVVEYNDLWYDPMRNRVTKVNAFGNETTLLKLWWDTYIKI